MQTANHQLRQPVAPQILSTWNANLQLSDQVAIAILYGHSLEEVTEAFNGLATAEVENAISHYYGLTAGNNLW